jgi:ABC-type tungstate transport system permease subunit
MSKEVLILTIVGTAIIIAAVLSSTTVRTTTSVFDDGVLSVLSPLPNV